MTSMSVSASAEIAASVSSGALAHNCGLPNPQVNSMRLAPVHCALLELGQAAVQHTVHHTDEFQRLIAYILEEADGRDRREPWMNRPGVARPVPKLRVALEEAFGKYGDLQWFKLNKTTNRAGQPLLGLFPRMAASISRIAAAEFGSIVAALIKDDPDAALLRMLHKCDGKVGAAGVQLFSRLAYSFRRDVYFVITGEWGERSGALKYIDNDLRRYIAVCQRLRDACDNVDISSDIRGTVFLNVIDEPKPDPALLEAIGRVIGPTLARYAVLEPGEAYVASDGDGQDASPLEFAAATIRARRGDKKLRTALRKIYTDQCAITGSCPVDLLEVAYVVSFPSSGAGGAGGVGVHSPENAILLRSDLHTLWDLNLIAIDPKKMKIAVSVSLGGSKYEKIAGRGLVARGDGSKVNGKALQERWEAFCADTATPSEKKTRKRTSARAEGSRAHDAVVEIEVKPTRDCEEAEV